MKLLSVLLLSLLLTGCATPTAVLRESVTADSQGGRARYWALQASHRPPPPAPVEHLVLRTPERTEAGVIRLPSTRILTLPRTP